MRGDDHRITLAGSRGREQRGTRHAVVVQSDELWVSTWLVAPTTTSDSAAGAVFRPVVDLLGESTRVLCEQTRAVNGSRLGPAVAHLSHAEMAAVDLGLRLVLDLDLQP